MYYFGEARREPISIPRWAGRRVPSIITQVSWSYAPVLSVTIYEVTSCLYPFLFLFTLYAIPSVPNWLSLPLSDFRNFFLFCRGLAFTSLSLRFSRERPDEDLQTSFKRSYDTILRPHHNFAIRTIVTVCVSPLAYYSLASNIETYLYFFSFCFRSIWNSLNWNEGRAESLSS